MRELLRDTIALLREEKRKFLFFEMPFTAKTPVVEVIKKAPLLPPPKKVEEVKKEEVLPPPPPPTTYDPPAPRFDAFEDLKRVMQKIAPQIVLHGNLPSDDEAKRVAQGYIYKKQASPISILYFQEKDKEKKLLENIAVALSLSFPAQLIHGEAMEKKDEWESFLAADTLKLIIVSDSSLWQQKALMKHFKEFPSRSETHLGKVPVFLLPNLSLYLKDPLLKRSLWKALCSRLSS